LGTSALLPHGAAGIALAASSGFEEVDVQLARVVLLLHAAAVAGLLAQSDFATPGAAQNTLFRCRFNTEIGNQAWSWKRALISAYAKVPLR
jgi:hypothetical protein